MAAGAAVGGGGPEHAAELDHEVLALGGEDRGPRAVRPAPFTSR